MANWIEHLGVFYNLDQFIEISRGDDDEIILSKELILEGMVFNDELTQILEFSSKKERDEKLDYIRARISL